MMFLYVTHNQDCVSLKCSYKTNINSAKFESCRCLLLDARVVSLLFLKGIVELIAEEEILLGMIDNELIQITSFVLGLVIKTARMPPTLCVHFLQDGFYLRASATIRAKGIDETVPVEAAEGAAMVFGGSGHLVDDLLARVWGVALLLALLAEVVANVVRILFVELLHCHFLYKLCSPKLYCILER